MVMITIAHLSIWEVYIEGEKTVLLRVIHMPLFPGHMAATLMMKILTILITISVMLSVMMMTMTMMVITIIMIIIIPIIINSTCFV